MALRGLPILSNGTISVTNGSLTVTGVDTNWLDSNNIPRTGIGAFILVDTLAPVMISQITANGSLTLTTAWPHATQTDVSYQIIVPHPLLDAPLSRLAADWSNKGSQADPLTSLTFNTGTGWIRIGASGGNPSFEASADGSTWTKGLSLTTSGNIILPNRMRVERDGTGTAYWWLTALGGSEPSNLAMGVAYNDSNVIQKMNFKTGGTDRFLITQYGTQISGSELATDGNNTLTIANTSSAPTADIAGGIFYVEGGVAKYRASDGNITPIADISNGGNAQKGRRNIFQNGACLVWQRGTSISGALSFVATMDGFYPYHNGGSGYACTVSQADVVDNAPTRSKKVCRIEYTNAGTGVSSAGAQLRFTAGQYIVGKKLVVSCMMRSNIAGLTTALFLYNNRSAETISDGFAFVSGSSIAPVSDEQWHQVKFAFPVKENIGLLPTDSLSLLFYEKPTASLGYIEFTDLQIEEGIHPTPFEITDYMTDLTRCQYHYEVVGFGSYGSFGTTTTLSVAGVFRTPKRTAPTLSLSGSSCLFDHPGVAYDTITPTLVGGGSITTGWFVYLDGFTSKTVQQVAFMRGDIIIADTGL